MKKYYLATLALLMPLVFVGCSYNNDTVEYALGEVNQQELIAHYQTFALSYQKFDIKKEQTEQIKQWPATLNIDIYFATWCHDSQREVPHLLKALQKNNQVTVLLIALDYQKSEPQERAKQAKVKYTPTFIVSLAGKEIGRIIEKPKKSLVDDISAMLKKDKEGI